MLDIQVGTPVRHIRFSANGSLLGVLTRRAQLLIFGLPTGALEAVISGPDEGTNQAALDEEITSFD